MLTSHISNNHNTSYNSHKSRFFACLVLAFITGQFCGTAAAQEKREWPCFHGVNRTIKSAETGLLKEWPEQGPELLWTATGLGKGYSSVSIAGGLIFTAGMTDKQTYVLAYDLKGRQVWKMPNGKAWETTMSHARSYNGSRSTPTYDDGIVYHLGETGRLAAFDYKTGKELWFLDLREAFDAEIPKYGYCESVLVDGDRLYCCPAGEKGFMACLDKRDGSIIWTSGDIPGTVGFSSPILSDTGGNRQLINMTSTSVYGVDPKTGKLIWSSEYKNQRSNNATDTIFYDGHVFVSSGYGKGSALIKLKTSGARVSPETVWQTDLMDNHHGGVILHDGYLYGAGHESRGWFCLDLMTGKEVWKARGKGSLVYADNMFYFLEEKGTMKLVRATHEKYDEISSFDVPEGGEGMHWAHPVVCGGRLYVRHDDKLFVYDIGSK